MMTAALATGSELSPDVKTQLDVLGGALAALKAVEAAQKSVAQLLELCPGDKTVLRFGKDAGILAARFGKQADAARKFIRARAAKDMPVALRKLGEGAAKLVTERLVDPSKLRAIPWLGETYQKKAIYSFILRVESDDLKDYQKRVEIVLECDPHTGALRYGGFGSPCKEGLTANGVAEAMIKALVGWPGMKGEVEATARRKKPADEIARIMGEVGRRSGFDRDAVETSEDLREIRASYRSHNLPKEGAYSVGEFEYDEMVREEIALARKAFGPPLAPFKDVIDSIRIHDGEKSWIYITVTLR